MNTIMKRIIGIVISLCIIFSSLFYLSDIVERKSSDFKYIPFFEEKHDFDVLFFGTSHVINGVFPMELWDEYGITAYNFGGHGNEIATSYWTMMNALDYTTPRVVVIDGFYLASERKTSNVFEMLHLSLDAFPLTVNKIRAVRDLWNNNDVVNNSQKWDILWDFSTYHTRWNELTMDDFYPSSNVEKGAESQIAVCETEKMTETNKKIDLTNKTIGEEYFEKIIEECQKRDIKVLLTYLPYSANEIQVEQANTIYDIADEFNVPYIDFLNMNIVDFETDFYDSEHLNPSGARKITEYLGQYIQDTYGIKNKKQNNEYSSWNEDYEKYSTFKFDNIREQKKLENYLMLLQDRNVLARIYIRPNSRIYDDSMMMNLIQNISQEQSRVESYTETDNIDIQIVVINRITGSVEDECGFVYSDAFGAMRLIDEQ